VIALQEISGVDGFEVECWWFVEHESWFLQHEFAEERRAASPPERTLVFFVPRRAGRAFVRGGRGFFGDGGGFH